MYDVIAINNVRLKANGNHDEHLLDLSKRLCSRGVNLSRNFPTGKTDRPCGIWPRSNSLLDIKCFNIEKRCGREKKKAFECCPASLWVCKPRMKVDRSAVVRRINAMCIVNHTHIYDEWHMYCRVRIRRCAPVRTCW